MAVMMLEVLDIRTSDCCGNLEGITGQEGGLLEGSTKFILTKRRKGSAWKCQVESRGLEVGTQVPYSKEKEEHSLSAA